MRRTSPRLRQIPKSRLRHGQATGTLPVVALLALTSVITAVYVIIVRELAVRQTSKDAVEQAALMVAQRLTTVSVEMPSIGPVGLADLVTTSGFGWQAETQTIRGLNSLSATVKRIDELARQENLFDLETQAQATINALPAAYANLKVALDRAVATNSKIYHQSWKIAAQGKQLPHENLVELSITLGQTNARAGIGTATAAPAGGEYLPGGQIFADPSGKAAAKLRFYQLGTKVQIVRPEFFQPLENKMPPSAVLVKAIYSTADLPGRPGSFRVRSVCVVSGAPPVAPVPSALMLSFPHGRLVQFHNLSDLLNFSAWRTGGQWLQSMGGSVPGPGQLVLATGNLSRPMSPSRAISCALYHWLLQIGPSIRGDRFHELLLTAFPANREKRNTGTSKIPFPNCALTREVGARRLALFQQSGPHRQGQSILQQAFNGTAVRSLPPSAVPLLVDRSGNCNLPGQRGFNRQLVFDFLDALHGTNMAAIETLSLSRTVATRLEQAIEQTRARTALLQEELASFDRAGTGKTAEKSSVPDQLKQAIERENKRMDSYRAALARAHLAGANAGKIATNTYQTCANMLKNAWSGLFRLDQPPGAFLIGLERKQLFMPLTEPISEDALYDHPSQRPTAADSHWLSPPVQPPDSKLAVDGVPLSRLAAADNQPVIEPPAFFFCLPADLTGSQHMFLHRLTATPFADTQLPDRDYLFYSENTALSGGYPAVGWSLLIRDLVANRWHADGVAAPAANASWNEPDHPEFKPLSYPSLAVEIQVRAPVILLRDMPMGSDLTNPATDERVLQIPPTPAALF